MTSLFSRSASSSALSPSHCPVDEVVVLPEGGPRPPDPAGALPEVRDHRLHTHRAEVGVVDGDDVLALGVDGVGGDVGGVEHP